MIEVVRYNQIEKWHSRKRAIRFYQDGILACDGIEQERYCNVLSDLLAGKPVCHDGYSLPYAEVAARGHYYTTTAPDGSRDYGGVIMYRQS